MNLFAVLVILVAIFGPHGLCSEIDGDKAKHSAMESREKRALYYPYNSAVAVNGIEYLLSASRNAIVNIIDYFQFAVVLAIPLSLKNRNVYMSYNFETNYYLPYFDTNQGLVPLPFATVNIHSFMHFDNRMSRLKVSPIFHSTFASILYAVHSLDR